LAGNLFMFVGLAYFLAPIAWLAFAATKSNEGIFQSFGFWFSDFHLVSNLETVFTREGGVYLQWAENTAIYALAVAAGSTVICAWAGYAFAKYRFRGKRLLYSIVLASIFVPSVAFAVPLYLVINQTGLSNSLLAVILPGLVFPFGVFLMRIFIEQAVSDDLLDAARVDGAGEFRIFSTIVSRIVAPGLVTVFLFSFVGAWNNYFLPLLVLNKASLYPLTVGLASWNYTTVYAASSNDVPLYSVVITGAVVAILPVIVLFIVLQRFWRSGLSLGGVTG
jgi:multiple sugar transport system permease protein